MSSLSNTHRVNNAVGNARINGVQIPLFIGESPALTGPYDMVVANLITHVTVEVLPELKWLMAPGGQMILSGILNEQIDRIDAALGKHDLNAVNYASSGMWLMVEAIDPLA